MNAKHRRTLAALFASPIARNVTYRDTAALLRALGCEACQGDGFRILFERDQASLHLHEPHPGKEIKPYQIKAIREFLLEIGVKP